MEMTPPQRPKPAEVLSREQLQEVNSLQRGVAVLDLFSKEVSAEDARTDFMQRTHIGSDSRQEILNGPSFRGDEVKLQRAVTSVKNRYTINHLRRLAMLEHANLLGIPAVIKGKRVIVEDPQQRNQLETEHGRWRQLFATRHRTQDRAAYREFLEGKIKELSNPQLELEPESKIIDGVDTLTGGPAVNLQERAKLLMNAINAMAHRSRLSGFDVATMTDRHKDPIWDRYQDGTPRIHRVARNKRERMLEEEVKPAFWKASGFAALRGSGVMRERELRPRSRKMWEEFTGQFEHPPQQKYRIKVRKQLKRFLPPEEQSPKSNKRAA